MLEGSLFIINKFINRRIICSIEDTSNVVSLQVKVIECMDYSYLYQK